MSFHNVSRETDKAFVDMTSQDEVKFTVVDALIGRGRRQRGEGHRKRVIGKHRQTGVMSLPAKKTMDSWS